MARLSEGTRSVLAHRLDPDGHIRDLIDVAYRRYHQRRDAANDAPPPNDERPDHGPAPHAPHP